MNEFLKSPQNYANLFVLSTKTANFSNAKTVQATITSDPLKGVCDFDLTYILGELY
jgi:hypothetical protein